MKMKLFLFLLLIVSCSCYVKVSIDDKGAFNITVNDRVWLRSARTALFADNRWYSTEDNSLPLVEIKTAEGTDPLLESWNETQIIFNLVRPQGSTQVVAHIRQWSLVSAFTFHLDVGSNDLTNDISLDYDDVRTVFPSFYIEQTDTNDNRGYFTYAGFMGGYGDRHAGTWKSGNQIIDSGMESGPLILFDLDQQGGEDVLVLSPFSHFMATSFTQKNNILEYGVVGSMSYVPHDYSQSMIVFYSQAGITNGVRAWGQTMQLSVNRTSENRQNDVTLNYLGYYTDNGGYYYYNTEEGKNYETTMIDSINNVQLPFKYLQLDSWWYFKGIGDGVTQWSARSDVFPDGLQSLNAQLKNLPFAAHNRYWAFDNVYKDKYAFDLDVGNGKALPIGNDSFWIDLLTDARSWGLVLYEQDWMNIQTERFRPTRKDIYLGGQWLNAMGSAADKLDINIQYCMSLPKHILQALKNPRVTQARASDDYATHLKDPTRSTWNIGPTSLFLDALGIAPFKDVFWSTSEQPGSPYGSTAKEVLPDREVLIATLSTGPVGPGDGLGFANYTRIMRCCRQDGLILKPDYPLTTLNLLFSDWASTGQSQGELYSTKTVIQERSFHIVFASAIKKNYALFPTSIGSDTGMVWSYDGSVKPQLFDDSNPLEVSSSDCGDLSICLWYISPVWQFGDPARTKYTLLGELNKWTAVSKQRFTSIATNLQKTQANITIQGVASEIVTIATYHSALGTTQTTCTIPTSSQSTLIISPTSINCA